MPDIENIGMLAISVLFTVSSCLLAAYWAMPAERRRGVAYALPIVSGVGFIVAIAYFIF
jgi:hypothetical protein